MFPRSDLYYTDPARRLITTGQDLDDVDRHLDRDLLSDTQSHGLGIYRRGL